MIPKPTLQDIRTIGDYTGRIIYGFFMTILILVSSLMLIGYTYSYAYTYTISSTKLVEEAKKYDGKLVYFEGEIIGEVMKRGKVAWLNLSDGGFVIGIFAHIQQLPKITYFGGYKAIGDRIGVEGIFHRACSRHRGELDIHAHSIKIVKQGHIVKHPINLHKVRIALILSLIAIIVVIIHLLRQRFKKIGAKNYDDVL